MIKGKKPLSVGISDFKDIIESKMYYADKTGIIEELISEGKGVTLFTRPRRFGKTLNMYTLKYFFDIENSEQNRKLFEGFYISETEYMKYQGQNPVIFISLKDLKAGEFDSFMFDLRGLIGNLYNKYEYLKEILNERELRLFNGIWLENEQGKWHDSLKMLSEWLYRYCGKKVVLLIDEYDTPIISSYVNGYYDKTVEFFRM